LQHPAQVRLAQYDHVVDAFTTDRPDQSFGECVLPRRACGEDAFWNGPKEITSGRNVTLSDLVAAIDSERQHENLSSAIRLFVLGFYRKQLSDLKEGRIAESIFWAAA
jgi:predicted DNA-binding ribbon-helix-helix protein